MSLTKIAISQDTKKALNAIGLKGETYDSIIRRLIKNHSWKTLDNNWNDILSDDTFIPLHEL